MEKTPIPAESVSFQDILSGDSLESQDNTTADGSADLFNINGEESGQEPEDQRSDNTDIIETIEGQKSETEGESDATQKESETEGAVIDFELEQDTIDWAAEASKYNELKGVSIKTKEDFILAADRVTAISRAINESETIHEISSRLSLTDEELLISDIKKDAKPWEDSEVDRKITSLYEPDGEGVKLKAASVKYAAQLRSQLSSQQEKEVNVIKAKVEEDVAVFLTYKSNLKDFIGKYEFEGIKVSSKAQDAIYQYIVGGGYEEEARGLNIFDEKGFEKDAEKAIWLNPITRAKMIEQIVATKVKQALSTQIKEKIIS